MQNSGLSLKYVFIVLAIGAALVAAGARFILPSKQEEGDRRVRLILRQLCARQRIHFEEKKRYSLSLEELGWSAKSSGDSTGFARFPYTFQVDILDGKNAFRILALEKEDRNGDGKKEIWEIGPGCTPVQK